MRLWHIDIIKYLPDLQLKAQWRELNSIFKNQPKHILINYVYNYDKPYLYYYTVKVIDEMAKRKMVIRNSFNFSNYFQNLSMEDVKGVYKFKEHNTDYLKICFYSLKEKYLRGQKDFDKTTFDKLYDFVNKDGKLKAIGIDKNRL